VFHSYNRSKGVEENLLQTGYAAHRPKFTHVCFKQHSEQRSLDFTSHCFQHGKQLNMSFHEVSLSLSKRKPD
jgi:hypothetical protein